MPSHCSSYGRWKVHSICRQDQHSFVYFVSYLSVVNSFFTSPPQTRHVSIPIVLYCLGTKWLTKIRKLLMLINYRKKNWNLCTPRDFPVAFIRKKDKTKNKTRLTSWPWGFSAQKWKRQFSNRKFAPACQTQSNCCQIFRKLCVSARVHLCATGWSVNLLCTYVSMLVNVRVPVFH